MIPLLPQTQRIQIEWVSVTFMGPQEHLHHVFCFCRAFLKCCASVFKVMMMHGCCQADEDIFSICLHFGYLHLPSHEALSKFCTGVKMAKMCSPFACVLSICMCRFNLNCIWSSSTTEHKSANVVTFLSVRLSIVMKPNTSSGSSSSLSSGTSDCWRIAKRRLKTLLTKMDTVPLKKWD